MPQLNYKHLLYFWTVAREGSIMRACKQLHLTQPAISAQLRKLEQQLGEPLFARTGRGLTLTESGRMAYRYAEEIFSLGRELTETLHGRPTGKPIRLRVGVTDGFPKLMAYRLLEPALRMPEPVTLIVRDDTPERLFAELSILQLDVVIADAPLPPTAAVRAYNHLLGECGVTVFGAPALAQEYAPGFPESLSHAPFLLPSEGTTLRQSLVQWAEQQGITLTPAAQISDSALLKTFGQAGVGLFAAPSATEKEIRRQYRVDVVGRIQGLQERFYAISVERRIKNPATLAISQAARASLGLRAARPRPADEGVFEEPAAAEPVFAEPASAEPELIPA